MAIQGDDFWWLCMIYVAIISKTSPCDPSLTLRSIWWYIHINNQPPIHHSWGEFPSRIEGILTAGSPVTILARCILSHEFTEPAGTILYEALLKPCGFHEKATGQWWPIMVNDGKWWLVMVGECWWCLLMVNWCLATVHDGTWFMNAHPHLDEASWRNKPLETNPLALLVTAVFVGCLRFEWLGCVRGIDGILLPPWIVRISKWCLLAG